MSSAIRTWRLAAWVFSVAVALSMATSRSEVRNTKARSWMCAMPGRSTAKARDSSLIKSVVLNLRANRPASTAKTWSSERSLQARQKLRTRKGALALRFTVQRISYTWF